MVNYQEGQKHDHNAGKVYCAKRDSYYGYLDREHPTKLSKAGNKIEVWECNGKLTKLCGNNKAKEGDAFCIHAEAHCPI